ncbi:ATP-binding protein [Corynebacterium sp. TAE3-ERU30]|uniref:ATP-binding protein n=1 Tax=Corynebacterium sp. TAE3-ERU30 TaxID=2849496 RepID=UPI001C4574AF|nr:ATP-binding protein [Corynebacterium sp. TAE3-ERU30]MBV7282283.1 ATP-binding protein [Corynebacterium sp. TAE3-ERU30]
MERRANPFRATLGSTPPYLAGRASELTDFRYALEEGPGAHERVTVVTGLRGVGKTVLLNAYEDEARAQSWHVISETATRGFMQRLTDTIYRLTTDQYEQGKRRITGLSIAPLGGVQLSTPTHYSPQPTFRDVLTRYLEIQADIDLAMNQEPVGLLITVDELHNNRKDEIIEFGAAIQHLVRENRQIAVAMAGIPQAVNPLLAADSGDNPVTFLRRANRVDLGLIPDEEVRRALKEPVEGSGCCFTPDALGKAVQACAGYPFMIQLVGHESFRRREGEVITCASVEEGAAKAKRKLGQLVHEASLRDLSPVDRTFLAAMATDDGPSRTKDIATRMGVDAQYVGTYRRRLIAAEMITVVGHGLVDFALPFMRSYLRG